MRSWLRGVELGGRGRYAAAAALLGGLLADAATPTTVAAHAAVTLASHRRQQGGHAAARLLDARGLRLAAAERPGAPDRDGVDALAARVDALVGLAADALGLGDPVAERLLDAAAAFEHPSWRPRVRLGWVRAELALFAGRAEAAVPPAEHALALARDADAPRHVLKSRLVLAVARAVTHPDGAACELDTVAADAADVGLLPLVWPALLAAADAVDRVSSPSVSTSLRNANDHGPLMAHESVNGRVSGAARRRHAATRTVSAVYQLSDPVGRRLMGESVWVPGRPPVT